MAIDLLIIRWLKRSALVGFFVFIILIPNFTDVSLVYSRQQALGLSEGVILGHNQPDLLWVVDIAPLFFLLWLLLW
jgi:hypothetical protein